MHESQFIPSASLGADLRALRKARGMTLAELGGATGWSLGWLSQVERDISKPSVEDLRGIASALGVPLSVFFGQAAARAEEAGYVVRAGARRRMEFGQDGLVEELLSPDLTDDFEVVHSTFEPGAELAQAQSRPTQEVGYVIDGNLTLWVGVRKFDLGPGDSFRIRGESYRWANPFHIPCRVIWVIAPPVY